MSAEWVEVRIRSGLDAGELLVLANLDRRTLLNLSNELASCTGTRLLISGVLLDQRKDIVEAFAREALYPVEERERDGWSAIEFARAQSCEGS
jgi:ribosomal protein L11 methylase PrmA